MDLKNWSLMQPVADNVFLNLHDISDVSVGEA